jgi:hypothetical protein
MTYRMLLALRALDAAEPHGVLPAVAQRQRANNLNATIATVLRKRGWICRAPIYLSTQFGGAGARWMLTDEGYEALQAHKDCP